MTKRLIKLGMNRVEGDLEIQLELDGHTVTDAWCIGTMYRGYEQILVGRDPQDGLVITPRICGICSTAQLYAAVSALEVAYQAPVAPNGTRLRNLCLMAEAVMSDARHSFLMFAPDFCNTAYRGHALFDRAVELFEAPFKGRVARETVHHTKRILGVVIAFGGQWPHATYMMPGGVTCPLDRERLSGCLDAIDTYTEWYEDSILGCTSERWLAVDSVDAFGDWMAERDSHHHSAVGVFARFGRSIGLHRMGTGTPHLLSAGCYYDPERWTPPYIDRHCLQPGGFYDADADQIEPFRHVDVAEHVRYSWFADDGDGRHPWDSATTPAYATDRGQYSFAKASRYRDRVVQLGPLADLVTAGDPLIADFFRTEGPSTWLRQFTRLHRPVTVLQQMRRTIDELSRQLHEPTHVPFRPQPDADGYSLVNASRGSLGHWIRIRGGKIENYQVITPTSWNGSPRDSSGRRGHWEESFIGTEIEDLDNPVELGHVIRSHDACLVCTVHFLDTGARTSFPPW